MNTPSPSRDSAVPSLFTEAQIQGAYMFACQELFQEFVQRNGAKSDPKIPDAIGISSMDLSKPGFKGVLPLIQSQRGRLFACMGEFLAGGGDRSLLPQAQYRYDQWCNPDITRTRKQKQGIQSIVHEGSIFRQLAGLVIGATKGKLAAVIIDQGVIDVGIEKRIHTAHMLFRGYMIRQGMTYDAAVKQATESLADMIQEFRDPIRDSGMIAIASFEKLVGDAIVRLIGRVNIDTYLLVMRSRLTTFQDIVDANREMGPNNPTFPQK